MKRASMRNLVLLGGLLLVLLAACKKDNTEYDEGPQLRADIALIDSFLIKNNLSARMDSASGIYYNIEAPGNGVDSVKYYGTTVDVLYKGSLLNGSVFDSTAGTTTRTFTYSAVITGWRFGLTKITKGGKIKLYIPSLYGYGTQAQTGIPANSVLVFDIELINLKNPI